MKRGFLQNLKVGDQALPDAVIDAIMAENGNDINTEKAKYADYDSIKTQLATATEALEKLKGVDAAGLNAQITALQQQLEAEKTAHAAKLADMAFDAAVDKAITEAKGRNTTAIRALLDADALKASKNQDADIKAAVEALKKDNDYLFESAQNKPGKPAAGTGSNGGGDDNTPKSLLEALRENIEKSKG